MQLIFNAPMSSNDGVKLLCIGNNTTDIVPGLFPCYDIDGLPRTNNDLEQLLGHWRHHQCRCTGRKVAPASLVVRGSVQIVAAITTQMCSFTAHNLATVSIADWQSFALNSIVTHTSAINNGDFAALQLPIWLLSSRNFSSYLCHLIFFRNVL